MAFSPAWMLPAKPYHSTSSPSFTTTTRPSLHRESSSQALASSASSGLHSRPTVMVSGTPLRFRSVPMARLVPFTSMAGEPSQSKVSSAPRPAAALL